MRAPCGKADSCEHCPYPDCTWDGLDGEEYRASYERDAAARHANQDKRAAQKRAYYEANREKLAAQKRAYYEKHKEQIMEAQRQRRARKRAELECEH